MPEHHGGSILAVPPPVVEIAVGRPSPQPALQGPAVIDFWAPWCLPCRAVKPLVTRVAGEYAGKVQVVKINVDEQPEIARAYEVQSIPTLIAVHSGHVVGRSVGARGLLAVQDLFEAAANGEPPKSVGIMPVDRLLRTLAGLTLLVLAWLSGPSWLLMPAGGLVLFSAVYDRCPIWRVISPRLARALSSLKLRS